MSITVVVMLVEVDACSLGGGGGGSTTPGECIVPANAETVTIKLRATVALIRRNLFTVVPPKVIRSFCIAFQTAMQNFLINLDHSNFSCKSVRECVRFARGMV